MTGVSAEFDICSLDFGERINSVKNYRGEREIIKVC